MNTATPQQSVLITGANGFIGSRLCRMFLERGFRVFAGVRRSANLTLLDGLDIELRYGDVNIADGLPAMVTGVDYIVHNAGVVKAKTPDTFFIVNEDGTRNLLNAIVTHNPSALRVVYMSSLAVAGPSLDGRPVSEKDKPHPITVYGRSKLAGERVALSFADRLRVVSIRPSGVYGPGDREIFTFFKTVYRGIRPSIGDVSRKLQLVHVDDLCRGVYRALVSDIAAGSVYFICENRAYEFHELTAILRDACGRRTTVTLPVPAFLFRGIAAISEALFKMVGATPMLTREKAGELLASWEVDTSRARKELGYESEIPFAEGARHTYDWYRREGWL